LAYRLELETHARRELLDLPKNVQDHIFPVLDDLQKNPRPPGAKKITGHPGYRVRKGQYRILYTVDDTQKMVRVYRVGNRRDVYRNL
jgi:mRNA interferase RelE/StbE